MSMRPSQKAGTEIPSWETIIECGLAIGAGWMFLVHLVTAKNPLFDRSMFADRNFSTGMVFMAVTGVLLLAGLAILPPLLQHLYGYSDGKGWVCQDFMTGNNVWAERGKLDKGAITAADGHLYLRGEGSKGTIVLIEATPKGFIEKGRFDQPDRSRQQAWPHPVVANGKLYIRDQDLLFCYDVKQK